jgi:hypothetical protein
MLFERLCFADFLSSEFAKTTALPYNSIMEFIETTAFTKYVYDYLTEVNIWVYKVFFSKTQKQARSFVGLVGFGKSAGQLLVKVKAVVYV